MPRAVELILFLQLFFMRTYTLVKQDKKEELPVGILARVCRTVEKNSIICRINSIFLKKRCTSFSVIRKSSNVQRWFLTVHARSFVIFAVFHALITLRALWAPSGWVLLTNKWVRLKWKWPKFREFLQPWRNYRRPMQRSTHLSAALQNRPVGKFADIYLPSCHYYQLFSR
jgi:hypothetical protein